MIWEARTKFAFGGQHKSPIDKRQKPHLLVNQK
jgi:hypothetical protein